MNAESGGRATGTAVGWLKDAGLDYLISNRSEDDNEENDERAAMVMFGSLTRRQSIAVQKRLREVGKVAPVAEHPTQPRRRGNGSNKPRGNSISSESPQAGRLVASLSGPLDTPSPAKTCLNMNVSNTLIGAARRSGSYDLGKLSITETPGVVLKSRRHVDIMEAYDACNPSDLSCVFREDSEKRSHTSSNPEQGSSLHDGFPIFSLTPCDAGITLACHDLSAADLVVVRRLAFIEGSAVFDDLNIRLTASNQSNSTSSNSLMSLISGKSISKAPSSSSSTSSLPNASLESMLGKVKNRSGPLPRVPPLITRLLAELCSQRCANTEGLFRIPPSQQRLRSLLQNIQCAEFNESLFDFSEVPPPDLAALLKHIIRSLSPSLLTSSLEHQFFQALSDIPCDSNTLQSSKSSLQNLPTVPIPPSPVIRERLRLLNLLVLQLPDIHRDTLQVILAGLRYLAGPLANNRMTASSLAVVLAPLFFPTLSGVTEAENIHRQVLVVQIMIIYADVLFIVPNQLLDQIRLHNTLLNQRNFVSGPKHTRKVASSWWRFWSRERVAARKLLSPTAGSPVAVEQPVITINILTGAFSKPSPTKSHAGKTVAGSGGVNSPAVTLTTQLRLKSDIKAAEAIENAVKSLNTLSPSAKVTIPPGYIWFLFEIGGNIHERCLDPQSLLLSVYRRNPSATWELRLLPNNRVLLPNPSINTNSGGTTNFADSSSSV